MASVYDSLEEEDLLGIKAWLLKCLKGKAFSSQNVPGLNYSRRLESLADVRQELSLVQAALDNLDPDKAVPEKVTMRAI